MDVDVYISSRGGRVRDKGNATEHKKRKIKFGGRQFGLYDSHQKYQTDFIVDSGIASRNQATFWLNTLLSFFNVVYWKYEVGYPFGESRRNIET